MKLASLLNHISVGAEFVGVGFGPEYMGAEFNRGRVCQGPSLLGDVPESTKYNVNRA